MTMGYTTDFYGKFAIEPALDEDTKRFLIGLATTRRMKRDEEKLLELYGESFGTDGEFFIGGGGDFGQERDETVVNFNDTPGDQPGLWCQWIPDQEGRHLVWDGGEKFYNADEWIEYLIDEVLAPRGYTVNGLVAAKGESEGDLWYMDVERNVCQVATSWAGITLRNGDDLPPRYFLKKGDAVLLFSRSYFKPDDITETYRWVPLDQHDRGDYEGYYKIKVFPTKEEAERFYQSIRLRSVFELMKNAPLEINALADHFLLLNDQVQVKKRQDLWSDPVYDYGIHCMGSEDYREGVIDYLNDTAEELI